MAVDPPETDMQPSVGSYSVSPFLKPEVSEQVRNRDPKKRVSWNWYDTWQEEHLRAFVVAKLCKADLLQEVHKSIQQAVDTGMTFAEWKKEVTPKLEGEWLGRTYGDIWENDLGNVIEDLPKSQREKKISPRRLETIYRTNMKVAHAAGQYQSLKDMAELYPYWRYCTVGDGRVREAHQALNGMVFRHDDPFWDTHYPPNGWNCRCYVRAMDEDDLEEAGLKVTDSRDLQKVKLEGQSGRMQTAYGVDDQLVTTDDGWNYNPGNVSSQVAAMAKKKVDKLEPPLKREVETDLDDYDELAKATPEPGKMTPAEQLELRRTIRVACADAESVAEKLKGITLVDQETVNRRATKQTIKQGQKVLKFVRNYQPEGIADDEQLLRIEELTEKLEAAEHAHKRLSSSAKRTAAASDEATQIQSELNILLEQDPTEEVAERLHKLQHRLHRLDQVAKAADNRALQLQSSLAQGIMQKIKQLFTGAIPEELRLFGITSEYSLKDRCSLEHCISSREIELIKQELSGLNDEKAAELRQKVAQLLKRSQDAVQAAPTNNPQAKDLETLATSLDSAMKLRDLHEQAFELRITNLPESEQQEARKKRQQVLDDRQGIQTANAHIFDNLQGVSKLDRAIETHLMKRELDLMMYNMTPAELSLYRKFIAGRIAADKNDYLYHSTPDHSAHYDPTSDRVRCDFRQRDLRNQGHTYYPRFDWSTRFHEEAHCLDKKFESGGHVATFPRKGTKGELLLASIQKDALNFINKALDKAGLPPRSNLDACDSSTVKTALLDYLVTERIQPESCANMTDLIGLATHGKIDRDNLAELIKQVKEKKLTLSPHQAKWRPVAGHDNDYNKRDYVQLQGKAILGHKDSCDETSEAFAEMTSSRWLGSDCYLTVFDKRNLSGSYGICQDIFSQMTNNDASGIQW